MVCKYCGEKLSEGMNEEECDLKPSADKVLKEEIDKVLKESGIKSNGSKSALAPGYKAMSLNRAITILKDRVDVNECDGECDAEKPYTKCKECASASVLNEVNDIVRAAL